MPVWFAASCAIVLWAHAFVAIGAALRELTPVELTVLRFVPLSLFAAAYVFCFHRRSGAAALRRAWPKVVVVGLLLVPVYNLALYHAQTGLSPALAAVIVCTSPIFTWAFAIWAGQERPSLLKFLGAVFAVAGVATALGRGIDPGAGAWDRTHVAAALISAVASAAFGIQAKDLLHTDEPLTVVGLALTAGTAPLLLFIGPGLVAKLPLVTPRTWLSIGFLAFGCTWLGFYFWFYALKRISATRLAVTGSLIPIAATAADWFWRGGGLSAGLVVGGLFSAAGIALTSWRRPADGVSG